MHVRNKKIGCLFLLVFSCLIAAAHAEEVQPLQGGLFTSDLTVELMVYPEADKLSLDEATRLALARNLDIQIATLDRQRETFEKPIADAIYDTQFGINATYLHDRSQAPTIIVGDRSLEGVVGLSLSKKLPTGTLVGVEADTTRTSTNSAFTNFSRRYETVGTVSVEQPLLRNFFGFLDRAAIRQVEINIKKFDYETTDRIEAALAEIRQSYWDLVFAFENITTRRKALRKAQDFLKIMTDQLDTGLSEKPDQYAAEANVRQRVIEVLEAENQFEAASDEMKVLLDMGYVDLIIPGDRPDFRAESFALEGEMDQAFQYRRDLKQFELAIESQEVEVKVTANERWPELKFTGEYGSQGLDRELFSSEGEIFGFNHLRYFAGFELNTALELSKERNRHKQAKVILESLQKELYKVKLNIRREVEESIRNLELAAQRVQQSQEIERLQRQKLEEEEKNFNVGRSDSKTIIDFQEDVIAAETEHIHALVDYMKELDRLYRSKHQLLDWAGVSTP